MVQCCIGPKWQWVRSLCWAKLLDLHWAQMVGGTFTVLDKVTLPVLCHKGTVLGNGTGASASVMCNTRIRTLVSLLVRHLPSHSDLSGVGEKYYS